MKANFLVLNGDGINCERETAQAFELAGATATIIHVNELLATPKKLRDFQGLALPGGFSFGDELGSGQILALKLKYGLSEEFSQFVTEQKPIIGICNGFQVLVKLGLLPNPNEKRCVALSNNESGEFIDRWVSLKIQSKTVCRWTTLLEDTIELPIRHGEGRLVFTAGKEEPLYQELAQKGQIPLTYTENVNGSAYQIASLCDPSGVIFGLMPHPEAYVSEVTSRMAKKEVFKKGVGQLIFESIVQHLN